MELDQQLHLVAELEVLNIAYINYSYYATRAYKCEFNKVSSKKERSGWTFK